MKLFTITLSDEEAHYITYALRELQGRRCEQAMDTMRKDVKQACKQEAEAIQQIETKISNSIKGAQ